MVPVVSARGSAGQASTVSATLCKTDAGGGEVEEGTSPWSKEAMCVPCPGCTPPHPPIPPAVSSPNFCHTTATSLPPDGCHVSRAAFFLPPAP